MKYWSCLSLKESKNIWLYYFLLSTFIWYGGELLNNCVLIKEVLQCVNSELWSHLLWFPKYLRKVGRTSTVSSTCKKKKRKEMHLAVAARLDVETEFGFVRSGSPPGEPAEVEKENNNGTRWTSASFASSGCLCFRALNCLCKHGACAGQASTSCFHKNIPRCQRVCAFFCVTFPETNLTQIIKLANSA